MRDLTIPRATRSLNRTKISGFISYLERPLRYWNTQMVATEMNLVKLFFAGELRVNCWVELRVNCWLIVTNSALTTRRPRRFCMCRDPP
jgi:hypothetical protein